MTNDENTAGRLAAHAYLIEMKMRNAIASTSTDNADALSQAQMARAMLMEPPAKDRDPEVYAAMKEEVDRITGRLVRFFEDPDTGQ